jgi:nucleotide-binding universal stress UspA family protein
VQPWLDPIAPEVTGLRVEDMVVEADRTEAAGYLEAQAAALRGAVPGLEVRTEMLLGGAAAELLRLEAACKVQLVVMSTHGRGGLERLVRGSVAEQVLRRGTAPVLLVRPSDEPSGAAALSRGPIRVLVPLDGSDLALAAVPHAWRVAAPAGEIALVAVIQPDGEGGRRPQLDPGVARAVRRRAAQDHLDEVARRLRRRGVPALGTVLTAWDAAGAIIDHAAVKEAGLVVMSTHGRGGLGRLLYGSVADAVARTARCPVLLVRPHPVGAEPDGAEAPPQGSATGPGRDPASPPLAPA